MKSESIKSCTGRQIHGVYPLILTKDLLTNLDPLEVKPLCSTVCSPISCSPVSSCSTACSPLKEPF